MIYCNLSGLIAEKKSNISIVARETGISRTTLTSLYYNAFKGIQIDTLNTLCKYFGVETNRLLMFTRYDISIYIEDMEYFSEENIPQFIQGTLIFVITMGEIKIKCDICCTLYFQIDATSVYVTPDLEYFDEIANSDDEELPQNNALLKKVLNSLCPEFIGYLCSEIDDKITDELESRFSFDLHPIISDISLSNLI